MKSVSKWITTGIPISTMILLQGANVGQLVRMHNEQTSAGQNVWSWVSVGVALWLWFYFYKVQKQKAAMWSTVFGILLNHLVIASVLYYRWA